MPRLQAGFRGGRSGTSHDRSGRRLANLQSLQISLHPKSPRLHRRASVSILLYMHDLGAFRANMNAIAASLATRGVTLPLDEYRQLDGRRRAAITESEQLQADKNRQSKEIGQLRKAGADTSELEAKSRAANERIAELKTQVDELDAEYRTLLAGIPNTPHESVPVGRSAE